jgi:hypothetical protein
MIDISARVDQFSIQGAAQHKFCMISPCFGPVSGETIDQAE